MAKLKKITKKILSERVEAYVQDLLYMEIQWHTAFGRTYRENGTIVEGSLRDTVDMGNSGGSQGGLYDTIFVKVRSGGLTIGFSDPAAEYIFHEDYGRPEFWVYVLEKLPGELALLVAEYEIYKKLGQPAGNKGRIKIN
jgi:hypothetical protein